MGTPHSLACIAVILIYGSTDCLNRHLTPGPWCTDAMGLQRAIAHPWRLGTMYKLRMHIESCPHAVVAPTCSTAQGRYAKLTKQHVWLMARAGAPGRAARRARRVQLQAAAAPADGRAVLLPPAGEWSIV